MHYPLIGRMLTVMSLLFVAGCASSSNESSATPAAPTDESSSSSSKTASSLADKPAERTMAETTSTSDGPRSSWRAERDKNAAATTGGDDAKLLDQLNDASRELATLRAANAKLRAERVGTAPATSSSRTEPVDEKLNATLRSYNQFKQELAGFVTEIDRLRTDNAALSAQLKEIQAKTQQNSGSTARLEKELQTEKAARIEAERTVASLRDQLRAVARAVGAAGVTTADTNSSR